MVEIYDNKLKNVEGPAELTSMSIPGSIPGTPSTPGVTSSTTEDELSLP
jgi:hypothetical protein